MIVRPLADIPAEPVSMEGAAGTTIRWLVSGKEGAPNFYMRLFEVGPGGHTPYHSHPGEHEIFILEGEGRLNSERGPYELRPGVSAFVPEGEMHQFENTGDRPLKFLCIVPSTY